MHVTGLQCVHCGRVYATEETEYYCPACGYHDGILDVVYDYDAVLEEINPEALAGNREPSMWRYLPLLPVSSPGLIPHLQVGWTPLYEASRLAAELGVARCWVKDEGRNPTASFKDRASAVGVRWISSRLGAERGWSAGKKYSPNHQTVKSRPNAPLR